MDSYQRFALSPQFQPREIVDPSVAQQRVNAQETQDFQRYINQVNQQNQNLIQDSKFAGQDLRALSQFSTTALDFVKERAKRTKEDIEIGQYIDLVLDPTGQQAYENPTENSIVEGGAAQGEVYRQASPFIPEEGRFDLQNNSKLWRGVQNEKALLIEARGTLPGIVQQKLNDPNVKVNYQGKLIPLFELAKIPGQETVASNIALRLAIKEKGLQYTSKRQFYETLAPTINQILQNNSTSLVAANIKAQKEDNLSELDQRVGIGISPVIQNPEAFDAYGLLDVAQTTFDDAYEFGTSANTGLSAGQLNKRVFTQMALSAGGNEDLFAAITQVQTTPGNTLGGTYPTLSAKLREDVRRQKGANDRAEAAALTEASLGTLQSEVESGSLSDTALLKARVDELTSQIGAVNPNAATAFKRIANTLYLEPAQQREFERTRSEVLGGKTFSEQELIDRGLNKSNISTLKGLQKDSTAVTAVSSAVREEDNNLLALIGANTGLKLNRNSAEAYLYGDSDDKKALEQALTPAVSAYKSVKRRMLLQFASSLRGEASQEQRNAAMIAENKRLEEYLLGEKGPFRFLGLLREDQADMTEGQRELIIKGLRSYSSPNAIYEFSGGRDIFYDFSGAAVPGQRLNESLAQGWIQNGGLNSNIAFGSLLEVKDATDEYNKTGKTPTWIDQWAEQLRVSPFALLKQQNRAWTGALLKPKETESPATSSPEVKSMEQMTVEFFGREYNASASKYFGMVFSYLDPSKHEQVMKAIEADPTLSRLIKLNNRPTRKQLEAAWIKLKQKGIQ